MTTAARSAAVEEIWFLDTLVRIRVPHAAGEDGISVIESVAPYGDSPPRHIHRTEDEIFHVLEGALVLDVDGRQTVAEAGTVLLAPKGVPHTYRVMSPDGARWLVTTARGDFEAMVRAASRPAERSGLPDPAGPPSLELAARFTELCAVHGIDLVGPPLT